MPDVRPSRRQSQCEAASFDVNLPCIRQHPPASTLHPLCTAGIHVTVLLPGSWPSRRFTCCFSAVRCSPPCALPTPCPLPTARTHCPHPLARTARSAPLWDGLACRLACTLGMLRNRNVANGPRQSGTPPTAAHKSNKHTPSHGQSHGVATPARRRRPRRDAASAQHKHQDACVCLLTASSSVDDARRPCATSKEAATRLPHTGASRVHRGRPDLPSQPDSSCYWSPSRQNAPHTP
jgi:hypothetical protein